MAEQEQHCSDDCKGMCCIAVARLTFAALIATIVTLIVLACESKDPVYSVAVTGVAGLDQLAAAGNLTSPVFNLTVRIDNAGSKLPFEAVCIERLSTVSVSYGDAVLGRGSVPQFCAKTGKVRERGARAWGWDVALPPFLRDQLAGELAAGMAPSVDVKVTTPAEYFRGSDMVLLCSDVKIGEGPAPCRKETVYRQKAHPGSTD